jgi:hypothetical protein
MALPIRLEGDFVVIQIAAVLFAILARKQAITSGIGNLVLELRLTR